MNGETLVEKKSRKLLIAHQSHYIKADECTIYLPRSERERGLIHIENYHKITAVGREMYSERESLLHQINQYSKIEMHSLYAKRQKNTK